MRSSAALNHGRRCVEELDKFDQVMGWTFRQLKGTGDDHEDDLDREISSAKQLELSCTAFGVAVDVPCEFVAPVRTGASASHTKSDQKAKHKAKKKAATGVHSSAYCKRATGATACSAAKSSAVAPSSSSHRKRTAASTGESKKTDTHTTALPRKDSEPVDFVYDLSVRRKLREEIDSERAQILHDAAAKEAELRATNKWVYDKADRPGRKQAWNCSDRESKVTGSPSRQSEAKPAVRASLAASSRSSGSSKSSARPSKPVKSSIAPNVSEWCTQACPVYPSAKTAMAELRQAEQQRRQQQWRDAKDVHDTIDDFESRMHQLAI